MKKNVCNIGGQAVLEGVMMRGKESMATAVRNPAGEIVIESQRLNLSDSRKKIAKIPVLRGIVSFFASFVTGLKITMRASEVYGDMESEAPSKFEKWLAKTFKIDIMNVLMTIGGILGVLLALILFVVVPQVVALAIYSGAGLLEVSFDAGVWNAFKTSTDGLGFGWNMLYEVIRGVVRMIIFVTYIWLVSLMKDIKRLFMYHGAEHKVISCYEHGLDLTVENARKMSTKHDRCGTTFMFIVMVVSMLFFTVVPVSMINVGNGFLTFLTQLIIRVALIPVVAGVSYEFLKLFAKYDNVFTRICKAPGLWLQKLTTKEPDDSMLEVSIAAFNEVLLLESDKDYPVKSFVTFTTAEKSVALIKDKLGGNLTEAEIIMMHVTGAKTRSELYDGRRVSNEAFVKAKRLAENRLTGAPLQYVIGETCFYGLDFDTDTRALIPRFDTEILAESAIKELRDKSGVRVLDLCTGSGCIAVAIKKNCPDATVVATDVSEEALSLAKQNARKNGVEIDFKRGSLFGAVKKEEKFDLIVTNPPYIPSGDIAGLDKEVCDYEPRLALDGGADGLDFYRDIAAKAKDYLTENGAIMLEVGINQAEAVKGLLGDDYETVFVKDYNDPPVDRVVIARLKASRVEKAE